LLTAVVGADVRAAVVARAERDGRPVSRVVDELLRVALGMGEEGRDG
jgi:hypothetical protein